MSVLELPEPAGWRGGSRFLALAVVGFLAAAVFYAWGAVLAAARGNYLTTAIAIGAVTFLLTSMAAVLLVALGRTTARTTSDAAGFTVWPDKRFTIIMLIGMVAAIPSCVLFAVFAPLGAIEFAETRYIKYGLAGSAAVAALIGISGLITAWRRGGVGHVKLTPTMIENADILAIRTYEWNNVVDVADHAESRKARRAVVLRLRDGREEIISVADIYLPRGVGLYWLVRHYWRHPEDRMELVDERALKRLREGRFDLT